MKIAAQLYLKDMCTKNLWPAGDMKQLIIGECLNQANAHMIQLGKRVAEDTHLMRN